MKSIQKNLPSLICVGLLFTATGYTTRFLHERLFFTPTSHEAREGPTNRIRGISESNTKTFTKDELYFGLSTLGGGMVSEADWQMFVSRAITPRFHEGLTIVDVDGQYLNSSGRLTKEKTKLVILIYEDSQTKNQMIAEVTKSYKQMFQQESVLRVTSSVKVSF